MKVNLPIIATGIISTIGASLCCISPVLALFSGLSTFSTYITWLGLARPYLFGLSFLCLAVSFYNLHKKSIKADCCVKTEDKSNKKQKSILWLAMLITLASYGYPYVESFVVPSEQQYESGNYKVNYSIAGMTCKSCEQHISNILSIEPGIKMVKVDYYLGNAEIELDTLLINNNKIKSLIKEAGYIATIK